jgi:hypothetical protein
MNPISLISLNLHYMYEKGTLSKYVDEKYFN